MRETLRATFGIFPFGQFEALTEQLEALTKKGS